jgi:hypothetical protein
VDTDATTLADSQTAVEMVVGTPSYMAPEQVRSEAIDSRTDICAFGAVLFEMLSGQKAFRRDTTAVTMTAVLKADPPQFNDNQHPISPTLDRIVRRCLEKNPELRFQSAKDLAFALDALSGGTSQAAAAQLRHAVGSRQWAAIVIGILVIAALSAGYFVGRDSGSKVGSFERVTFERGYVRGLCQEDEKSSCCTKDEGGPFEAAL